MGPISSREEIVSWIDSCVLGDLRTLRLGIDGYYARADHRAPDGRALGGGNFLLVAGCCLALDYFGYIYHGGGSDEANALAYIEKFLVAVNPRYSEAGLLMWRCFRQGTVHRSWPKRIYVENDPKSQLILGADSAAGGLHLNPDPSLEGESFIVNGRQLLADIEVSFNFDRGFRRWILDESPDQAIERANPQALVLRPGDRRAMAQLANVRSWYQAIERKPG